VNPEESCWRSRSKSRRPKHPGAHVINHRTANYDGVSTFDAAARCDSVKVDFDDPEIGPVAYWRRVNDALVEAGEPPLASSEAYDFYKSGLSSEDALILKLFGAERTAPRDLSEAFDRTFGTA
jgi:hypothetical protein